jgi:AcrR family transcriptional regulator
VAAQEATLHRGERSRRAILDAAAPIFAEHGYTAASLNQIIEASGLTKGGFYFHFPSKLELALAVIRDQNDQWLARVNTEVANLPTARERLTEVPRVLARMMAEGAGPAWLRKLTDELSRDPDLREEVCGGIRTWIASAAEGFLQAQAEGDVRRDVDADEVSEIAIGLFVGMQTLTEQLGDGDFDRRLELSLRFVEAAVTAHTEAGPEEGGTS